MPEPWLGIQLSPSSSVKDMRLALPRSCDEKVRPVTGSVNRIGSSEVTAFAGLTSSQLPSSRSRAGEVQSSKRTRRVLRPETYITVPPLSAISLFQLTPRLGSPEACSPGSAWTEYVGDSAEGTGEASSSFLRAALPEIGTAPAKLTAWTV